MVYFCKTTKLNLIKEFDKVLSLNLIEEEKENTIDDEIIELINKRNEFKKNKDFINADRIRDDLLNRGIKLIDTREGTSYEFIN